MKDLPIRLDDLPDEILIYIFKKLDNHEVLYSLMGVNQRLNRIVYDKSFTRDLCLLENCSYNDSTLPLPDPTLDRFCSKILPDIGDQIESLFLEPTSIERVLHATNYPHLNHLGLCNISSKAALFLFGDKSPFNDLFKDQISSLVINSKTKSDSFSPDFIPGIIFKNSVTFTNLRCLKLNPSVPFDNHELFCCIPIIDISSTLLELHISVNDMESCFRILNVTVLYGFGLLLEDEPEEDEPEEPEQKLLPNLRIFSLSCDQYIDGFDQSIVAMLRRMLNLEELHLNFVVERRRKFIDGDTLNKDIIIYMPRLYKFTFNIFTFVSRRDDGTIFPSNEHIQKTFEYFNNQIITSIDHFEIFSQCHIYSYPYKWKVYNDITNNFQGGLFTSVTQVSLHDEKPFENDFFLRIAQSFPLMKKLTIDNRKAQNDKQFVESNNVNQVFSIIEYPNLTRLDLYKSHDDYAELFLFDTKISLPNNLHLRVDYGSLQKVTHCFTKYTTQNNCAKLAALYFFRVDQIDEHFKNYFPHTHIRCNYDFKLAK